eukprot:4088119-Pleurochrysis_carterae.AAC.2
MTTCKRPKLFRWRLCTDCITRTVVYVKMKKFPKPMVRRRSKTLIKAGCGYETPCDADGYMPSAFRRQECPIQRILACLSASKVIYSNSIRISGAAVVSISMEC